MIETNTATNNEILEIHQNIRKELAEIVELHEKNLNEILKINGKIDNSLIKSKINDILDGIEMGKMRELINKNSPLYKINKTLGSMPSDSEVSIKVLVQILTILDKYIDENLLGKNGK